MYYVDMIFFVIFALMVNLCAQKWMAWNVKSAQEIWSQSAMIIAHCQSLILNAILIQSKSVKQYTRYFMVMMYKTYLQFEG